MDNLDLDKAVSAGILRAEQADALRRFEEQERGATGATEEQFAFVSGFADVMAAVGLALTTGTAAAMIGSRAPSGLLVIPVAAWFAATFFTTRRRMMLTSIFLFIVFALSVAIGTLALVAGDSMSMLGSAMDRAARVGLVCSAAATAAASYAWWRQFRLPVAVAACALATLNAILNLARLFLPGISNELGVASILLGGPAIFVVAMLWDMSDVRRETIRSSVAFWLHLIAGYLLVQGAMALILGVQLGNASPGLLPPIGSIEGTGQAAAVLAVLFVFALVALVIDRRSLLTSGMIFFVPALSNLLGNGMSGIAPALFAAGLLLTILAVRWLPIRRKLLGYLPPALVAQLPRAQLEAWGPRPVR